MKLYHVWLTPLTAPTTCVQGHMLRVCVKVNRGISWIVCVSVIQTSNAGMCVSLFKQRNVKPWNYPQASIFPFPLSPLLYLNFTSVFICGVCGLGASASARSASLRAGTLWAGMFYCTVLKMSSIFLVRQILPWGDVICMFSHWWVCVFAEKHTPPRLPHVGK